MVNVPPMGDVDRTESGYLRQDIGVPGVVYGRRN
jgi:hypothetical protein